MTTKSSDVPITGQRRAGARQAVDVAYGYLAAFFVLGVLFQVYLAGIGIFGINSAKVANATSLNPHRAWGTVLMVLSLILLILALIAWASRATVVGTFVLALLVIVAQTALAAAGDNSKWIGGLHALDGMVILLLSLWLAITARRRQTAARRARLNQAFREVGHLVGCSRGTVVQSWLSGMIWTQPSFRYAYSPV